MEGTLKTKEERFAKEQKASTRKAELRQQLDTFGEEQTKVSTLDVSSLDSSTSLDSFFAFSDSSRIKKRHFLGR